MSTSPRLKAQEALSQNPTSPSELRDVIQYPEFLLFGDSITQFSTLTLQAYVQTQYIRRLDVVNRGFSGYTSIMALGALNKLIPPATSPDQWPRIKIATIFFGANDACVPGEAQHVELSDYLVSMDKILDHPVFRSRPSSDDMATKLIVITPPPVNEHQFIPGPNGFLRRAGLTSQYAEAIRDHNSDGNTLVLDIWTIFMRQVGWSPQMGRKCCQQRIWAGPSDDHVNLEEIQHIPGCQYLSGQKPNAKHKLSDFLVDGLHLTKLGYDVLFESLMALIKAEVPELLPERMPFVLLDWKDALP